MPRVVIEAGGREGIARRDRWDEGGLVCVDEPFFIYLNQLSHRLIKVAALLLESCCCRLKSCAVSKLGGIKKEVRM